jgi:hypothetical protein
MSTRVEEYLEIPDNPRERIVADFDRHIRVDTDPVHFYIVWNVDINLLEQAKRIVNLFYPCDPATDSGCNLNTCFMCPRHYKLLADTLVSMGAKTPRGYQSSFPSEEEYM